MHPALVRDSFAEKYLGKPVHRLIQPELAESALETLIGEGPVLVEAKLAAHAVGCAALLTGLGFRMIDINVQLDAPADTIRSAALPSIGSDIWIRDAAAADRDSVERVASVNLVTSRYHLDPQINPAAASRFKAAWAGNFFDGTRGQRLLVAERYGAVGGFLQVLEADEVGTIDLIALDSDLRGSGAFDGLIRTWLEQSPAIGRVVVGTQVSNVRSLRSYERVGFRVRATTFVLHYHVNATGEHRHHHEDPRG
jgi:ribosomal protein S18 acetylase RimI-like enzyme